LKTIADFYRAGDGWCKACHRAYKSAKRKAAAELRAAAWAAELASRATNGKTCCRCNSFKVPALFPKDAAKVDGLGAWCKQCKNEVRAPRQRGKYATDSAYAEACRARTESRRLSDPAGSREVRLSWKKRQKEGLGRSYILKLLVPSGDGVVCRAIPPELIEVKRQHLKLLRELKKEEANEEC
jgi:hypothetical protein